MFYCVKSFLIYSLVLFFANALKSPNFSYWSKIWKLLVILPVISFGEFSKMTELIQFGNFLQRKWKSKEASEFAIWNRKVLFDGGKIDILQYQQNQYIAEKRNWKICSRLNTFSKKPNAVKRKFSIFLSFPKLMLSLFSIKIILTVYMVEFFVKTVNNF